MVPPWWAALLEREQAGDEAAKRYREGWEEREVDRLRIVRELAALEVESVELEGATVAELEREEGAPAERARQTVARMLDARRSELGIDELGQVEDPKHRDGYRVPRAAVTSLRMDDGRSLAVHGRALRWDWLADTKASAEGMRECCSSWAVRERTLQPMRCNGQLCPQCQHAKAVKWQAELADLVAVLVALGCTVVHATFTRRAPRLELGPVVLTESEKRAGLTAEEEEWGGWACPGETLHDADSIIREAWRDFRNGRGAGGRACGALWNDVVGYVYGHEVTGRSWTGGRAWLRWHSHIHALLVLRPGVGAALKWDTETTKSGRTVKRLRGGWVRRARKLWCRKVDAEQDKQVFTYVAGPLRGVKSDQAAELEDVRGVLAEVLKYPFKLCDLTRAQLAEALCYMKGRHHHQTGGALHAGSHAGAVARAVQAGALPASWSEVEELVSAELARGVCDWPRVFGKSFTRLWSKDRFALRVAVELGRVRLERDQAEAEKASEDRALYRPHGIPGLDSSITPPANAVFGVEERNVNGACLTVIRAWVPLLVRELEELVTLWGRGAGIRMRPRCPASGELEAVTQCDAFELLSDCRRRCPGSGLSGS